MRKMHVSARSSTSRLAVTTIHPSILWAVMGCCILCLWSMPSVSSLAIPKSEIVNRRKSPALWREDLQKDTSPTFTRGLVKGPPEVMAPVGGWPQLQAALANGADSIYLGLSAFSARARASNFDPTTELPQAVEQCHAAGVKVYVALNTLVFDQELQEVEELIRQCAQAQVDALIVQDLGIARLAQTVAPQLEIHASTQQTITSADGAAFCEELFGTTRVVLGRELSVQEIDLVAQHLDPHVEIEAFCHGALCVSYSGQCFSSEAWGGRSANRGQCAQACRLPYGLIDNGELKELGDFAYLLSPQDLCGIDQVPQLLEAHVSCLKIEGRLKDAAYVAATTRAYRNAVDQAWKDYCQKHGITGTDATPTRVLPTNEQVTRKELAQVFSRGQDQTYDGLSQGFFQGSQHQVLVRGRSPRHRGVHVGRVIPEGSNWKQGLIITTDNPGELKLGDGIVVDRGMAQEEELGGAIFEIHPLDDRKVAIRFSRDTERNWKKYDEQARKSGTTPLAPPMAHVWKTSDATLDKKLKRLSEAPPPKSKSVKVSVTGALDQPLQIRIDNGQGLVGVGISPGNLQAAERQGLSSQSIQKAIGTLGNTDWNLQGDIDMSDLEDGVWCPLSWIKDARRDAVEDLELQLSHISSQSDRDKKPNVQYGVTSQLLNTFQDPSVENGNDQPTSTTTRTTKLSVLARNFEQVNALCQMIDEGEGPTIDEIIIDFLEVDGMREAMAIIRQTKVPVVAVVASPRIIKPEESGIWRTLLRLEPDALLVRSTGLLYRMMKLGGPGASVTIESSKDSSSEEEENVVVVTIPELIGDFSLNVANALTAWELLEYGCSRVTASYDLSANAIGELLETVGPRYASQIEVVAHAHLPIFHTEHCVFARFLSNGNSYVDCGHACTRHNVHLRDQTGADNLVLADMGCRNTVFSAQAQSGAYSLMQWMDAGAKHFRIELVDESGMDAQRIVSGYRKVLDGDLRPKELWSILGDVRDSNGRVGGVGHGSFRNEVERRAGELK